LHIEPLREKLN